jgi:hypothetical protein
VALTLIMIAVRERIVSTPCAAPAFALALAGGIGHTRCVDSARPRTYERIGALVPVCVVAAAGMFAWYCGSAWFGPTERLLTAIALLGTIASAAAIWRDDIRARVFVTCILLLGAPALRIGELRGHTLAYIQWDHGTIASIVSVTVLVAILGLVRRRVWGRWLAVAGSLAGLGGSLLNGIGSLVEPGVYTWAHACAGAGCASLVLLLIGPTMRDAFEDPARESLWRSREPVIRALRAALLSTLVAAPMLLVYAITQPVVPGTATFALVLAGVQLGATVLCLLRKVVGALLLSLAGAALLVFTLACGVAVFELPESARIVAYYAVFWVPAGIASVIASATLLRPLRALLREN